MTNDEAKNQMVHVPIGDYIRDIACHAGKAAAKEIIQEHVKTCPNMQEMKRWRAKLAGFVAAIVAITSVLAWILGPALAETWHKIFGGQ